MYLVFYLGKFVIGPKLVDLILETMKELKTVATLATLT